MYKVCWNVDEGICSDADILKAFDVAIQDGVDVLSMSIGSQGSVQFSQVIQPDNVLIGSFHAVERGIPVVCAAGNDGPGSRTVVNTAPWILTVAASSIDRSFPTPVMLDDNRTFMVNSS